MKARYLAAMAVFFFLPLLFGEPVTYYVDSVHGRQDYPGDRHAPFADIAQAMKQIRMMARAGAFPKDGVCIRLMPGTYVIREGIELTDDELCGSSSQLVFDGGGKAVLTGAVQLSRQAFEPVTDEELLARLPVESRGHVRACNLKALGLSEVAMAADVFRGSFPGGELFVNGERQPMARWPEVGWGVMGAVKARGDSGVKEGNGGVFDYTADTPADNWLKAPGVWLHGFWTNDWLDEIIRVDRIDDEAQTIRMKSWASRYGIGSPQAWNKSVRRFAAVNLPEELDRCGEWCLEPGTGRLVAWLKPQEKDEILRYSVLEQPFFRVDSGTPVEFRGITFECARGNGLELRGKKHKVVGCTFRNLAGDGVIASGYDVLVDSSTFAWLGSRGVVLDCGDEARMHSGSSTVSNCHFHHLGVHKLAGSAAVRLGGCWNYVSRNLIHDLPHAAIIYGGNHQVIERNCIFSVCLQTEGTGALYSADGWTSQDNVVRWNFIHHIGGVGEGNSGICLDNCDSGERIEENLFSGLDRAVVINGGRDNSVVRNLFAACGIAVVVKPVENGENAAARQARIARLLRGLEAVNWKQYPWSTVYPKLTGIMEDSPELPLHNVIKANVLASGVTLKIIPGLEKLVETDGNHFLNEEESRYVDELAEGRCTLRKAEALSREVLLDEMKKADIIGIEAGAAIDAPDMEQCFQASLQERRKTIDEPAARRAMRPVMPRGRFTAAIADERVDINGELLKEEWAPTSRSGCVRLETDEDGGRHVPPAVFRAMVGADGFYAAFEMENSGTKPMVQEGTWGSADGVEFALRDPRTRVTRIWRGLAGGHFGGSRDAGCSEEQLAASMKGVRYSTRIQPDGMGWRCEWFIPWSALGGRPAAGTSFGFNAMTINTVDARHLLWRAGGRRSWDVRRTGEIVLP